MRGETSLARPDAFKLDTSAAIRDVVLSIQNSGARIVGFTSPLKDKAVISCAEATTMFFARSGRRALLVDLSATQSGSSDDHAPGPDDIGKSRILHREQGFDQLTIRPNHASQYLFLDVARLRAVLEDQLHSYAIIILSLTPVFPHENTPLSPLDTGAACDSIMLVCQRGGLTHTILETTAAKLRAARCNIGGLIVNEIDFLSPGEEIARLARRVLRPFPRLRSWIERGAIENRLLN